MPNVSQITRHLELSFWSLVIRLLTESRLLRRALPALFVLLGRVKIQAGLRVAFVCSLSGFLIGLIVGVISVI